MKPLTIVVSFDGGERVMAGLCTWHMRLLRPQFFRAGSRHGCYRAGAGNA
jgi:hypothetical protein